MTLLCLAVMLVGSGCVLFEDLDQPAPRGTAGPSPHGVEDSDFLPVDSTVEAQSTVQRSRLEDRWGAGQTVALLTGTLTSKDRNFALNIPLASWYVREQDRKGMGLLGGALAYDMVTTQRVEGQAVSQKLTSFGLLGIAGNIDERRMDGSGGYRKFNWFFPFFRYQNINGERVLYPFFIFPVPLQSDDRAQLDPPPWQQAANNPIDPPAVLISPAPQQQRRVTLKHAPQARPSNTGASMDRISTLIRERPAELRRRRVDRLQAERDSDRATSGRGSGRWTARKGGDSTVGLKSTGKTQATSGKKHRVRFGDTLYSISRRHYGNSRAWKKIFEANRATLSAPDKLKEGMSLVIPQ